MKITKALKRLGFWSLIVLAGLAWGISSCYADAGATDPGSKVPNTVTTTPAPVEGKEVFSEKKTISLAETHTWVGIAKVILQIDDLTLFGSKLSGNYRLNVPLRSSKNDCGTIELRIDKDWQSYLREGGCLKGEGFSQLYPEDPARKITCEVFPDGEPFEQARIALRIDTGSRILNFNTTVCMSTSLRRGRDLALSGSSAGTAGHPRGYAVTMPD